MVRMVKSENWEIIEKRALENKERIKLLMDQLIRYKQEWELPRLSEFFNASRVNLDKTDFNIVVCGEVKHGKSSLLNAVIGEELLPVNVREATCQVFRVSNAPDESYELVFTDGHREKIKREELARYCSQVEADLRDEPLLSGRTLNYIDIKTPIGFLPEGAHLVDTPGLGATYLAHSEITMRYVKEADAVVFVTNSTAELTAPQLDFLERILTVTKEILVVQTKIDMVDEDNWQELKRRNKELLAKRFPQEKPFEIYPISSRSLLLASDKSIGEKERGYSMEDSLFPIFREALDKLIYRTTGLVSSSAALEMTARYLAECSNWFDKQIHMLAATSEEEKNKIQESQNQLVVSYQQNCGTHGTKRTAILNQIRQIMKEAQSKVLQMIAPNGPIASRMTSMIQEQTDFNSLNDLYMNMNTMVYNAILDQWNGIADGVVNQLGEQLAEFSIYASADIPYADIHTNFLEQRSVTRKVKVPYKEQVKRMVPVTKQVKKYRNSENTFAELGAAHGAFAGAVIGTAVCPGLGTAIGWVAGSIFGGACGSEKDLELSVYYEDVTVHEERWKTVTKYRTEEVVENEGIERNRSIVLSGFNDCLSRYRSMFYSTGSGNSSPIQTYFSQIQDQIAENMEAEYKAIESQMIREKQELERQSKASEEKREHELILVRERKTTLAKMEEEANKAATIHRELEGAFK